MEAYRDSLVRIQQEGWLSPTTEFWLRQSLRDLGEETTLPSQLDRLRRKVVFIRESDTVGRLQRDLPKPRLRIIPIDQRGIDSLATVRRKLSYIACRGVYVQSDIARVRWELRVARYSKQAKRVEYAVDRDEDFRYRRRKSGWFSCAHVTTLYPNIEMP